MDSRSQDGSRLLVTGIPPGIEWQELKDHFGAIGRVAFVNTIDQGGKSKGAKGGKGDGKGMGAMAMGLGNPVMEMMMMQNMQPIFKGGGGCDGGGGVSGLRGEVRYDNPLHAQLAVGMLNGSTLNGAVLHVGFDGMSQDGRQVKVAGIAPGTTWKDLKDHFRYVGQVGFANVL